jgi:hypothetical protein
VEAAGGEVLPKDEKQEAEEDKKIEEVKVRLASACLGLV